MFDPKLAIGQELKNTEIVSIFHCGNMGGMRRSKETNTLVLVSDYTKGLYHDKWIGGILHYTGTGKNGDQDINYGQNKTLANCNNSDIDVHLFEVIDAGKYIYCGRVELVDEPYKEIQPDENGNNRTVWMFPIRPVPINDVVKPPMFVFSDMEDYRKRGNNVDREYARILADKKARKKEVPTSSDVTLPIRKAEPKPIVEIPDDIIGKRIKHKRFGLGTIIGKTTEAIIVSFDIGDEKNLGYKFCLDNKMFDIIE